MDLLELVNGHVIPTAHALIIEPFKTIWERDPDDKKSNAIKVFSVVELFCSPKKSNPFHGVAEDKRLARVKKEIFGDENYRTTDWMILAMNKYHELLMIDSPSYDMYDAAIRAKEELTDYLNTFKMNERTNGGAMVIKPKDVTSALKEVNEVAKKLEEGRLLVNAELIESSKTRGLREIGDYER